jgi:SPP1 family predicted phage head-tail adaptor
MPPPLEIGRMDDRVTIQTLVETPDAYGQEIPVPVDGITVWARVRPPTGREVVNADQTKGTLSYVVMMLYRTIDETQQLLWGTHVLRLTAPPTIAENKLTMTLYCTEQTSGGGS